VELPDLRVGIVGLGKIGERHAEHLVSGPARFVAGLDVEETARRRFEREYDVDTHEDVGELLAAVDAVIVTTPNRFHEEYAVAAMDAGVALLLEKPLAHTLESGERIAAAAADADAVTMVGFHNRYAGGAEVLAAERDADRFGDVTHVEAVNVRRRGTPAAGSWFTAEAVAGGGALIDMGVHALDLALHLAGFPEIEEVSAATRREFDDHETTASIDAWGTPDTEGVFDVEDSATAFLRGVDGTTLVLEAAWAANREPTSTVRLRGTDGGASLELGADEATIYEAGVHGTDHLATTAIETRVGSAHEACQRAFLEAVAAGRQPERNTIEQALAVQRIVDAIYRSSEAGEAVVVD